MKFLSLFLFAFVCLAVFVGQSQVQANRGGGNQIVMKDGHLILSTSGGRRRGGKLFN